MLSAGGAPNFRGTTYPGDGERIGPAWRAVWSFLADGQWHNVPELAAVGVSACWSVVGKGLRESTVQTLLYEAGRDGHLEKEIRADRRNVRRAYYRRVR